jgi:hypothetical protein
MIFVFDEIDSIFDAGDMLKLFDKLRGYVKDGNKIILMTAYLSDFVREFIIERFKDIAYIKINVKDNGYSNVNTYLTNSQILKNLDFVCNIEDLVLFTNQLWQLTDLLKTYNNTTFQLIAGDTFKSKLSDKIDGYERIVIINDTLNINPNLPVVFTSTIKNGGDIYFSDVPKIKSKTFIVDFQNLLSNNDVCQVIGRIRDKECIRDIYVFERNSKPKKFDYSKMHEYNEPINGDYSLLLSGTVAPFVEFENTRKFQRDNISVYTALTKGSYFNYHHFDRNKKGEYIISKTYKNYLKYLEGCNEFKIVNHECTVPKIEKEIRQMLWKDYVPKITYPNIQDDCERLFKQLDFNVKINYTKDTDIDYNDYDLSFGDDNVEFSDVANSEVQQMEKINRCTCRFIMDTLVLKLGGTILRKYKEVRWYSSFTAIPHDLRPRLLTKYGLYEYDIKTCNPFLLSILTHQHKELFNSNDFDFYNYFRGDTERKEFKTIFNAGLNGMYQSKDINKSLKKWMERFQFEPLLYDLVKSFVEKKGMFFRIMGSFEDNVMRALIRLLYELHLDINIERLHDGLITTQPLNSVHGFAVNDYNLTLTGNAWDYYNDDRVSCMFHNININTYNLYKTQFIYETFNIFDNDSYQEYLDRQKEINDLRKMVLQISSCIAGKKGGGNNKINTFVDKKGVKITRNEIANLLNIPINDVHFLRKIKHFGYEKC